MAIQRHFLQIKTNRVSSLKQSLSANISSRLASPFTKKKCVNRMHVGLTPKPGIAGPAAKRLVRLMVVRRRAAKHRAPPVTDELPVPADH